MHDEHDHEHDRMTDEGCPHDPPAPESRIAFVTAAIARMDEAIRKATADFERETGIQAPTITKEWSFCQFGPPGGAKLAQQTAMRARFGTATG